MSSLSPGIWPTIAGLAVLLGAGALIFATALWFWTVRMLTRPPRRGYAWALARQRPSHPGEIANIPPSFSEWTLESQGLSLPVWDIEGRKAAGPTVILTPGWGQARVGCLDRVEALLDHVARIVVWDLPGTGEAPGRCTLGAREASMLTALIERVGTRNPTVLMGASMGAGMSIQAAAARHDIRGVIAEAPYRLPWTPALGVLRAANLPSALNLPPAVAWVGICHGIGASWSGFDRALHAANLQCPLLVLHGTGDDVCPIEDGRAIAEAASDGQISEIHDGDHHALWTQEQWRAECVRAVAEFLQRLS